MDDDFIANGKQVLLGRDHIADACDEATAKRIAAALNKFEAIPAPDPAQYRFAGVDIVEDTSVPPGEIHVRGPLDFGEGQFTPGPHSIRQEGDEYACVCGKRWDMREGIGHP